MPSENMRTIARGWLYNAEYPNECASQQEVDDLATLLDKVRGDAQLETKLDANQAWTEHLSECEEQTGYMRGRADAVRLICAWMRSTRTPHAQADAIERGDWEHTVVVQEAPPLRPSK